MANSKIRFKDKDGKLFPDWEKQLFGAIVKFSNGLNIGKEAFGKGVGLIKKRFIIIDKDII